MRLILGPEYPGYHGGRSLVSFLSSTSEIVHSWQRRNAWIPSAELRLLPSPELQA